jgi:hypothetical protein
MPIIVIKTYYDTIKSLIFIQIYYIHYVFRCILCELFNDNRLFQLFLIIFNYFIPIEISGLIALPLRVALHVALCLRFYWLSLHIAGPSQCPLVDKPHPASVPGTRPAVAGRSRKEIALAVGNGSCVADWTYWQFSQDTFNRNDVENCFLVV